MLAHSICVGFRTPYGFDLKFPKLLPALSDDVKKLLEVLHELVEQAKAWW